MYSRSRLSYKQYEILKAMETRNTHTHLENIYKRPFSKRCTSQNPTGLYTLYTGRLPYILHSIYPKGLLVWTRAVQWPGFKSESFDIFPAAYSVLVGASMKIGRTWIHVDLVNTN